MSYNRKGVIIINTQTLEALTLPLHFSQKKNEDIKIYINIETLSSINLDQSSSYKLLASANDAAKSITPLNTRRLFPRKKLVSDIAQPASYGPHADTTHVVHKIGK